MLYSIGSCFLRCQPLLLRHFQKPKAQPSKYHDTADRTECSCRKTEYIHRAPRMIELIFADALDGSSSQVGCETKGKKYNEVLLVRTKGGK